MPETPELPGSYIFRRNGGRRKEAQEGEDEDEERRREGRRNRGGERKGGGRRTHDLMTTNPFNCSNLLVTLKVLGKLEYT